MYSVAFAMIVALFSLCAGASPSRSSPSSPSRPIARNAGTLCLSSMILSLRLLRYRFSMTLCEVFFTGGSSPSCESPFSFLASWSTSAFLLRPPRFFGGSGDV